MITKEELLKEKQHQIDILNKEILDIREKENNYLVKQELINRYMFLVYSVNIPNLKASEYIDEFKKLLDQL